MTAQRLQPPATSHVFVQRFSATRRGAALARRLAVWQLDSWGVPYGTPLSDTAAHLVAELAANAVLHGRVLGRDFELRVVYDTDAATVRVEVSDTHPRRPDPAGVVDPHAEGGRGLALVQALSRAWGVCDRPGPGKTVWAETAARGARAGACVGSPVWDCDPSW
ncbi:ATP-binding protein [Streptomyces sp. NPDC060194]|uniref:ATP-binding protein n=1 Tax=Streptomyces sp. NPDC060194 TaxID=3347069 RepID=UPI003665699E